MSALRVHPPWPPSGDEVGALFRRIGGGTVDPIERVAWLMQVSPRTALRWRDPARHTSAVSYASWLALGIAGERLSAKETCRLFPEPVEALEPSTRRGLERLARAATTRKDELWRPTAVAVSALVSRPHGYGRSARGVRASARALRVEPSTVLRWLSPERPRSSIPFTAWTLLLGREGLIDVAALFRAPLASEVDE